MMTTSHTDYRNPTMTALTLAAAQTVSIAGDVDANIARHLVFMQAAAARGVQLLVFPELSLTAMSLRLQATWRSRLKRHCSRHCARWRGSCG